MEVPPRSGMIDDDNRRLHDEPEEIRGARRRERARTPATVAEPDSTMSNDTGDQTVSTDAEPTESLDMVDYALDERYRPESNRCHIPDAVARDIMTRSGGDPVDSFRRRFRLDRVSGLDAASTAENRLGTTTKQFGDTVSSESTLIGHNVEEESELVRLAPRKRQSTEVEAFVPTTDQQPVEGMRKKHRPDPLVLSSSSSVEHYGYPSWLRSPRSVWNGTGPVPYTPPPMLSPARRAPGLFWTAAAAQAQPLWSLFRQPSAFTCK